MARLNVSVPDELVELVRSKLPDLNVSAVLQDGLRDRLRCKHERLACSNCAQVIGHHEIADVAVAQFYADLLNELTDLVSKGGTAEGAARVAKKVAIAHHAPNAHRPLPRPTRAEREATGRGRDDLFGSAPGAGHEEWAA